MDRRFPATRRSVLLAARDADPENRRRALGTLAEIYWKPIYKYLRVHHRAEGEEAGDLTQGFFALALEKGTFERFEPARARFRTYLRLALDGFVANERKAARRLKRGGGAQTLSLDFGGAEAELAQAASSGLTPEEYFRREWIRALFARAVERLRADCEAEGRPLRFVLFERCELEPERPTYAQLALKLGVPVVQVTNDLAAARRHFRRLVLEELREVTGSDAEFLAEARDVLGVDPR
jgi:RNA polymerase sigma factor (sigma-70 family)